MCYDDGRKRKEKKDALVDAHHARCEAKIKMGLAGQAFVLILVLARARACGEIFLPRLPPQKKVLTVTIRINITTFPPNTPRSLSMNNRERSVKKRKRDSKNSHTGPGTDHKSPFEPFRATEGSRKHKPKSPNPNSRDRKRVIDQQFIEPGGDEVTDSSDPGVADGVLPSAVGVFSDLNIAPAIQRAIASMGFSELKEIQRNLIPTILARKDVSFSLIITHFNRHQS